MIATPTETACPLCKHKVYDYGSYTYCSEFCAETTQAEKTAFKNAQHGDDCVFPCMECGCPMEGEYSPDDPIKVTCSSCWPKRQLRVRTEILKKVLPFLPEDLKEEAQKALEK